MNKEQKYSSPEFHPHTDRLTDSVALISDVRLLNVSRDHWVNIAMAISDV